VVCCGVLQRVVGVLQRVAACCSVLQRVAACCSVLQCVVVGEENDDITENDTYVAVCCNVLQCGGVLQCIAVCSSVFRVQQRHKK